MALLDHHRAPSRSNPAGSAFCIGLTLAGLTALAVVISWMMTFV
ncbi:hypothetical protein [Caulobacter sp.]|nr:hypothetical protein [Caulobacter sp.]HJV40391.1 hypothetical protein [Caulobacter sp.]